jgi:L-lysine 6-monooxygenase (NADPH-requiring)
MNLSRAAPLDVIGVGFGPSNLALAIALEELAGKRGRHLDTLFLERQADYHSGLFGSGHERPVRARFAAARPSARLGR